VDRHKIWRYVSKNYKELKEASPDGYEPVVEVFLIGRPAPFPLAQVQTVRDPDLPWVLLISTEEGDGDPPRPNHLVWVPEQYVERVEIWLERSEKAGIGFSHRELDEPSVTSSPE
jgi:hypothetical protein